MKSVMANAAVKVSKRKLTADADKGESSESAKEDRLRISSFQGFWKNTLENLYLLRALHPRTVEKVVVERIVDFKKVYNCI